MTRVSAAAAAIVLASGVSPAVVQTSSRCAVPAERSSFVFRSGFWLNLHNFLHRGAKERRGINIEVPAAMTVAVEDTAGARALTAPERRAWEEALRIYDTNQLAQGKSDSILQRLNERLAAARDDGQLRDADIDPAVRQALLTAAPVYRLVWWPVHDRRNRKWIASLEALLAPREACLSRSVARALAAEWPARPIVVDASVYASWFGAYMTQNPVHITMSSNARGNQGSLGIEGLLHEAGHSLTGPVDSALTATAARAARALPRELAHLILFYTAGETVRDDIPDHVPYAERFGLWKQSLSAERYRALLEREWRPHLEGRRSFADAIARIVGALPRLPA